MRYLIAKMFYLKLFCILVLVISFSHATSLKCSPVPDEPLTAPLPAKKGSKIITPDWLL